MGGSLAARTRARGLRRCLHRHADLPAEIIPWRGSAASAEWMVVDLRAPPRRDVGSAVGGVSIASREFYHYRVDGGVSMASRRWQKSGCSPDISILPLWQKSG